MKTKLLIFGTSVLVVALLLSSVLFLQHQPGYVYRIYVDGTEVGVVADPEEYKSILEEILSGAEDEAGLNLDFAQEITAVKEFQWSPEVTTQDVQEEVSELVSFLTMGWAIVVDGEIQLYLADEEEAHEVLELVAENFTSQSSSRQLLNIEILDDVQIEAAAIKPQDVLDVQEAVNYLTQGRQVIETYVVSRGDSVWSIARSHQVSESELREANPQLRNNSNLQIGQELNLVKAEPKVNVKTVEKLTTSESIPFTTTYRNTRNLWYYQTRTVQAGVPGRRDVIYEVEYLNGVEVSRTLIESKVVSDPVSAIVERGTSNWPSGTAGNFRWPLNTGRITDRFGAFQSWRVQRHEGVDIAAPGGTPIYAAAGGTVTVSAYHNSYGNYVIIDHGNGYSTLYAHASTRLVSVGQRVSRGDVIARVGNTGFSTGNHLHFEIRRNGNAQDPLRYYRP